MYKIKQVNMKRDSYQKVWDEVLKRWEKEMIKPKVEVIKKEIASVCGKCNKTVNGIAGKRKGCTSCDSTGKYKDYHYIMIVGKYAYDMDSLK